MASLHQISKYYQSFSGTDTLAFILMPGCKPVVIGSLTTISYSMYRNKKPVINIGRTNINGVTRGSRIFAGTMIFTLIHQHWLRELQEMLQEQFPLLANVKQLKVDELPLFDIMIVSANEYGNAVSMYIYGIDFTDEAQTISVEDLFTENTFSFVARDISTFQAHNTVYQVLGGKSNNTVDRTVSQRFYVMHSDTNLDDVAELGRMYEQARVTFINENPSRKYQSRELYYSPSMARPFIGDDVATIQTLLAQENPNYKIPDDTLGTFTEMTGDAVRAYQASHGLEVTGVVDERTYMSLLQKTSGDGERRYATCINRNGAIIYTKPDSTQAITGLGSVQYGESIEYKDIVIGEDGQKYYQTEDGYIMFNDMYSYDNPDSKPIQYPVLKYGDYGNYVAMLQKLLRDIYPEFTTFTSGFYDLRTQDFVLRFKKEHGLANNSEITYDVWSALQAENTDIFTEASDDGFYISVAQNPGHYEAGKNNLFEILNKLKVEMYANSSVPVKISAIANYEDGSSDTNSKTINVKDLSVFSFNEFKQSFVYNPEHGNPTSVEFIVYPYNKKAYKWVIDYEQEEV